MTLFGILSVDKPAGLTSRDVVNRVDRLVRPAKAGHAGTLDPLATGVLVVCIGPASRLIEHVQRGRKTYEAVFRLGAESDTEDVDGQVHELPNPPCPSREALESAAARFIGRIEQRPPAYSALKVQGRRAYAMARAGETVDLKPRPIDVYRFEVTAYAYPRLEMLIECGSGTYVRSLGRDLARTVGTESVMTNLRRTAVGPYTLSNSVGLADLTADSLPRFLLPPTTALFDLPQAALSGVQVHDLHQGKRITLDDTSFGAFSPPSLGGEAAALDSAGRLVALLEREADDRYRPRRNFPLETEA